MIETLFTADATGSADEISLEVCIPDAGIALGPNGKQLSCLFVTPPLTLHHSP